jgi:hypothetical protein
VPKFFFHIDGDQDPEGTELESLPVAKCQAVQMAGELICEQADRFWDNAEWTMMVTDETGLSLFQLHIVGIEAAAISARAPAAA